MRTILVTDELRRSIVLPVTEIVMVKEIQSSPSSKQPDVNSTIRTRDNQVLTLLETIEEIRRQMSTDTTMGSSSDFGHNFINRNS